MRLGSAQIFRRASARVSLDEFLPIFSKTQAARIDLPMIAPRLGFSGGDTPHLEPLATPLMVGGLSNRVVQQLNGLMSNSGMVGAAGGWHRRRQMGGPVAQAGTGIRAGGAVDDGRRGNDGDRNLHRCWPRGDANGERIVGFGHSFNNEGAIDLPMGSGRINAVIANLSTSFKLGESSDVEGALLADQTVGVAGRVGTAPAMIPMTLHVQYADGGEAQAYHFKLAQHSKLTPMLASAAFMSAWREWARTIRRSFIPSIMT